MPLKFLPNLLSLLRLILVIPFVYFFFNLQFSFAIIIFLVAALTDALDGWLARLWNCQTRFGLLIDPIADKILIVACVLLLGYHQLIPHWLVVLILSRDVSITLGAAVSIYIFKDARPLRPSLLSKLNTVMQMLMIMICMLEAYCHRVDPSLLNIIIYLVSFTTFTSFLHYFVLWFKKNHHETA